jgi:NAD(P)H-dependent FMN reductase
MKRIEIISGTNRPHSNTRRIAGHLHEVYRSLGTHADLIDLELLPADVFLPSVYKDSPASFRPTIDRVLAADGLVVVIPEYNGGPPGILKYFIDLLPFPQSLDNLPACFVGLGAGEWGGLRPVEQMQQVFGYRHSHIFPQRVFIPKVTTVFDADGRLADEKIIERLATQASRFADFVNKLRHIA